MHSRKKNIHVKWGLFKTKNIYISISSWTNGRLFPLALHLTFKWRTRESSFFIRSGMGFIFQYDDFHTVNFVFFNHRISVIKQCEYLYSKIWNKKVKTLRILTNLTFKLYFSHYAKISASNQTIQYGT